MDREVLNRKRQTSLKNGIHRQGSLKNAKGKLNMAKIDTTKIEGFDSMSAEEKLSAILGYEFEEPKTDNAEINKYKTLISKANAEAAKYKDELRAKQTEAERAEADRLENEKKLQDELNAYRTKERISSYKAQLMTAGYDAETAGQMAKDLPDGVSDSFFAASKAFLDNQKQTLLSEALDRQPKPSVGTPPTMSDAEKIEQMNLRRYIGLKN